MFTKTLNFLKTLFSNWSDDKAPRIAAALAYYTAFALAPILLICIAIVGFFLGKDIVQEYIFTYFGGIVGEDSIQFLRNMLDAVSMRTSSIIETIIAVIILIVGAAGFFGELQTGINSVWGVKSRPGRGLKGYIKDRFFSFTMVMGVAFLLLVSLIFSIFLESTTTYINQYFPGGSVLAQVFSFLFSLVLITVMFALILKYVPEVIISWRDVFPGAFITAFLFTIGKFVLAIYLGRANFISTFGAASSLIVILIWVYYSTQILLFGVEFTKVYSTRQGKKKVVPSTNAILE